MHDPNEHEGLQIPVKVIEGNGKLWKLVLVILSATVMLAGGALGALLLNDRANLVGQIQNQQKNMDDFRKEYSVITERVNIIQERQNVVRAQLADVQAELKANREEIMTNGKKLDEVILKLKQINAKF